MGRPNPNKLLVEGRAERGVIVRLMQAHGVLWGDDAANRPVDIREYGGSSRLLAEGAITTRLKEPGLKCLGVVVDADDNFSGRWQRVRDECIEQFPALPNAPPGEGLVQENAEGMRLGVWIMPDNRSRGMLETFLTFLPSRNQAGLWEYVEHVVPIARERGAHFRSRHIDKAKVYTYLAWQDEPGMLFGTAIASRCLDPHSEHALPFVKWFKNLYQLSE
ncbi:MAG: hypothetical protein JXQ73_32240 [Phycisphaerae bacterium]|nr:hypothetical protein [Phycisphaerae bacterium]